MLNKVLFLLLISAAAANATVWNIVVTKDEHVDILYTIIEGINYFFGIDNANAAGALEYLSIVKFVLVLGTLWALIQLAMAAMSGNATMGFKHYFMYLFMVFTVAVLIYGPRSQVLIQTRDGSNYQTAKDVPMVFAFTLSMFTKLRYELTEITHDAFNIPDPTDNFVTGDASLGYYGGQINIASSPMNLKFSKKNTELATMFERFGRDCVILPLNAGVGGSTKMSTLLNSKNTFNAIAPTITGFPSELITYNGITGTCQQFWDSNDTFGTGFVGLKSKIEEFQESNFDTNSTTKSRYEKIGNSLAYFGALINNDTALANASAVKASITQAVLSNEFRSVFAKMGVAGQVASDGAAQTMANMQLNGISTGMFVAQQLPRAGFLLFALMVASTPFLLAFAMFPGSASILLNFLKTLLWISLWEPMGNILGIFQDYHFANVLKENGITTVGSVVAMTPNNIIDISSEAASLAGIAGGLYVAIQGLSWMLITGSGQMIGNLMGSIGQSFQSHANADAQLQTRGEMQQSALLSKNLGRDVSLREMYHYNASTQAAQMSGQTMGTMTVHGTNALGAASSVAGTTGINSSFGMALDKSMARSMSGFDNAANTGGNKGTQDGHALSAQYGKPGADYGHMGDIQGSKNLGLNEGVSGEYKNPSQARAATKEVSRQSENILHAEGDVLSGQTQDTKDNLATHMAEVKRNIPVEAMRKFKDEYNADKGTNISDQEAYSIMAKNMSTNDAANTNAIRKDIEAHRGASGTIHDKGTNAYSQGAINRETADINDSHGEKGMDKLAKFTAKTDTGAKYVKMGDLKTIQSDAQKHLKMYKDKKQKINKEIKAAQSTAQKLDARKDEIVEKIRKNDNELKSLKNNNSPKAETRKEEIQEEQYSLAKELSSIGYDRAEVGKSISMTGEEIDKLNQDIKTTETFIESLKEEKIGHSQSQTMLKQLGEAAQMTKEGIVNTLKNGFDVGSMDVAERNSYVNSMNDAGISNTDVAAANGAIKSVNQMGKFKSAQKMADFMLKDYEKRGGDMSYIKNLVGDNATPVEIMAAIQATNDFETSYITKDGTSVTTESGREGVERVQVNRSNSFDQGVHIKTDMINEVLADSFGGDKRYVSETKANLINGTKETASFFSKLLLRKIGRSSTKTPTPSVEKAKRALIEQKTDPSGAASSVNQPSYQLLPSSKRTTTKMNH